jgi:hypothetical protein
MVKTGWPNLTERLGADGSAAEGLAVLRMARSLMVLL